MSTLGLITRTSSNKDDEAFFTSFFAAQEERSKACTIIADEIYVKSCLRFSGKTTYKQGRIFFCKPEKIPNSDMLFFFISSVVIWKKFPTWKIPPPRQNSVEEYKPLLLKLKCPLKFGIIQAVCNIQLLLWCFLCRYRKRVHGQWAGQVGNFRNLISLPNFSNNVYQHWALQSNPSLTSPSLASCSLLCHSVHFLIFFHY